MVDTSKGETMLVEAVLAVAIAGGPRDIPDSLYTGKWYNSAAESYRKCVVARESGGNYRANGRYGSGAYQFIQSTWDHYADLAGLSRWVGVRPYKAPKKVQDHVFWRTYWNGKGRHHWGAIHALTIGKRVHECH
jgi:muramidase (phage lysozyme)